MFPTESIWVRPNARSNGFMMQIKNPQGLVWNGWGEFYARPGDEMAQPGQEYDLNVILERQAQEFPDIQPPLVPVEQIQIVPIANDPNPVGQVPIEPAPVENGPIPHGRPGPWENPQFLDHGPMQNEQPPFIIDNVNYYQEGDPGIELIYVEEHHHEEFSD